MKLKIALLALFVVCLVHIALALQAQSSECFKYKLYRPYLYMSMTDEDKAAWMESVPVRCRMCK